MKQYYDMLESKPTDTLDAIKAKRNKLVGIHHPDKNPTENKDACTKKIAEINSAWDWIKKNHSPKKTTIENYTSYNPFEDLVYRENFRKEYNDYAENFHRAFEEAIRKQNDEMYRKQQEEIRRQGEAFKKAQEQKEVTLENDLETGMTFLSVVLKDHKWKYNSFKKVMEYSFEVPGTITSKTVHMFHMHGPGPFGKPMKFRAKCNFQLNVTREGDFLIQENNSVGYPMWFRFRVV